MALLARSPDGKEWKTHGPPIDAAAKLLLAPGLDSFDLVLNGADFELWEKGTAPQCAPEYGPPLRARVEGVELRSKP